MIHLWKKSLDKTLLNKNLIVWGKMDINGALRTLAMLS